MNKTSSKLNSDATKREFIQTLGQRLRAEGPLSNLINRRWQSRGVGLNGLVGKIGLVMQPVKLWPGLPITFGTQFTTDDIS